MAALALVLLLAVGLAAYHLWTGRAQPVAQPKTEDVKPGSVMGRPADGGHPTSSAGGLPASGDGAAKGALGATGGPLHVDVTGDVRKPGVHHLPPGSRVEDALRAAGGVVPGASEPGLNRARLLVDGEQVRVGQEEGEGPAAPEGGTGGPAGPAAPAQGGVVSLNSATVEQLRELPGIGPVLAQQIVDFRTNQGGFASVDQLREVSGIGDHRFSTLRPLVGP